ncbi:MAG: tetratricopeptide repeat protein [Spirochaetes bacterium]|nr:tetratricopeptide repeat protein [Spirochaetota bacterium]
MNNYKKIIYLLLILMVIPIFLKAAEINEADRICEKGIDLYNDGQFRKAVLQWERSLNINPDHKLAHYYLIKCTEEKNKIDNYTSLGLENYEEKKFIDALANFNIVFEYDVKNEIATKYVAKIGESLDKTPELKSEIVKKYKEKGEEHKKDDDPLSVKKTLAVYNIARLLNPQDNEARENKIEYEKKMPDVFKKENLEIYIKMGQEYFKEEKYDEAIYLWQKALNIDPKRTDIEDRIIEAFKLKVQKEKVEQIKALLKEGEEYVKSGLFSSAIVIYEEVLRLDPNNKTALQRRDELLKMRKLEEEQQNLMTQLKAYLKAGKKHYKKENYEKARELFINVLSLDEKNKEAQKYIEKCNTKIKEKAKKVKEDEIEEIQKLLEEGIINYKDGKFELAISRLSECLSLSPGNNFASEYLDLAKKALWARREEEIDIKSPFFNMIDNMIKRGEEFYNKKEYQKSVDVWRSILFIFPLNIIARENIVKCSRFLSPELFTTFIDEHITAGKKYLSEKNKRYALKEFELVKKLFPKYTGIDEMIRSASPEPVIKKTPDPELVDKYYREGIAAYKAGNYKEAVQNWEEVLKLEPAHQKSILNINKVNHILNYDTIKAKRDKVKVDREQVNTYYFKGLKYYNKGKLKEAIDMWKMVLKLDPGNIKAKNNIETCSRILKKY